MSVNIVYEGRFLIESFCLGIWLMIVYDVLRVIRLLFRHRPIWTGLEDLGYWIYASIATFMLLYRINDGQPRGFAVGSVFLGMILYDKTVSRFFIRGLKKILKYLKIKIHAAVLRRNNK